MLHKFLEFLLLCVIVTHGNNDDNNDGEHDTGAFLEALSQAVLDDTERGGDDGGDDEYLEDEVLEDLTDHVTHSACLSLMPGILAITTKKWKVVDLTNKIL